MSLPSYWTHGATMKCVIQRLWSPKDWNTVGNLLIRMLNVYSMCNTHFLGLTWTLRLLLYWHSTVLFWFQVRFSRGHKDVQELSLAISTGYTKGEGQALTTLAWMVCMANTWVPHHMHIKVKGWPGFPETYMERHRQPVQKPRPGKNLVITRKFSCCASGHNISLIYVVCLVVRQIWS
jgi:hypothetical protein